MKSKPDQSKVKGPRSKIDHLFFKDPPAGARPYTAIPARMSGYRKWWRKNRPVSTEWNGFYEFDILAAKPNPKSGITWITGWTGIKTEGLTLEISIKPPEYPRNNNFGLKPGPFRLSNPRLKPGAI